MIRKATKTDASRIAEIQIFAKRTAYRSIFQDDYVSFQGMQVLDLALSYRKTLEAAEDIYVYDDGIIKGMMSWDRHEAVHGGTVWELKELYVEPFFQGQKIGGSLLSDFLLHAEKAGASGAYLWVLEKNTSARRFYEAHGFLPNGERRLEEGTAEYVMQYIINYLKLTCWNR